MNNYLLYLTGSGLCLGLFYLTYWTFLRNITTHKFCRFYLISVVIIALIIPVINISINNLSSTEKSNKTIIRIADTKNNYERFLEINRKTLSQSQSYSAVSAATKPLIASGQENDNKSSFFTLNINFREWLLLIYIAGAIYFLIHFCIQLIQILVLTKKYKPVKEDGITYVFINKEISPFSFFNYIFINKNNYSTVDYNKIIEHEKVHIKEHHTLDVLIAELLVIIQWFNPFIRPIRNSIKKTHEYLADKGVLMRGHDIQDYQSLLLQQLIYPSSFQLTNSFNFKPIKKRLAMMTKIQLSQNNKYALLKLFTVFVITCIAIAIGVIVSCTNSKTQHYNIVEIKGEGNSFNYTKFWGYMLRSDSLNHTAMLVEQDDFLAIGENLVFFYKNIKEKSIDFKEVKPLIYVNGKIHSLVISDENLLPWFQQMKISELKDLQSLVISSQGMPEDYYPYLKEIAKVKPNPGLFLDKETNCKELLQIFSPAWIIGLSISQDELDQLSGLKSLELLDIKLKDSVITKALPYLPNLKQFFINIDSKNEKIGAEFFKNNPQIERLFVPARMDLSVIKSFNNLKELSIFGDKEAVDIDFLKDFKKLEVLRIIGGEGSFTNLLAINKLPALRWLGLHTKLTQQEFNSIIDNHKSLEVLEILNNDSIKSFVPLLQLENLYGLIITDKITDKASLRSMKNLKYLSIPKEVYNDNTNTAELRKALPSCTIVPNEGFCLGSGWLLLLAPFIIILKIFARKKKTKVL
jgi:beta-lactamase regulating signal transducer with metallopeptidase domain